MGGTKATRSVGSQEPAAPQGVAEIEAQHWRDLATERDAAMRTLTRRPLVRIAVGIDRRVAPLARSLGSRGQQAGTTLRRAAVAGAGLGSRPRLRGRRAALAHALAQLAPAPSGRSLSVITLGGEDPDRAAAVATADVLCFVPSRVEAPDPAWMARLAATIGGDVVAATPTLVHPRRIGWGVTEHDLLVRAQGFSIHLDSSGSPVVVARGAGDRPVVGQPPSDVDAAPLHCLVVDRAAYVAAGGLGGAPADDIAGVDLCTRLRGRGGRVQHVADAIVFDDRPVPSRAALFHPLDPRTRAWQSLVERHGPALARSARREGGPMATRWIITTGAPSARLAPRWGDSHLAEGLARALRRLGEDVLVQTHDDADSLSGRSHDVHLVLHGLAPVRRTPGQRHILWVISHPETLDLDECDTADVVLVASSRFADHVRVRTSTPVEVLLQATDADRFSPRPVDPVHQHPVTVVAKTRNVLRPMVVDALAAGIRPAIYGSGWRQLVDPDLVVTDHIDNDLLPAVYCSAGVVLNDHWDTMRAWGFVSNRILDVLACGAPIISDHLDEVRDLFGDAVPTYRTSRELSELVACALEHPDLARKRAADGRAVVLAHHTFDHRAQALVELLERHDLRRDNSKDGSHP